MAQELSTENSFLRWCKKKLLICEKLVLRSGRGWPDRTVLLPDNRVAWVELKSKSGKLSPHQEYWIAKLADAGHEVCVCDNLADAQKHIEELCNSTNTNKTPGGSSLKRS